MSHRRLFRVCFVAALLLPGSVFAQKDDIDRSPQSCITVSRIRSTEVLDDRTIIFYMRGDRAYVNELPRTCPRLGREERFGYRVRSTRLCSSDFIQVIELGFGARGATCRLGRFTPMTHAEAEALEADFDSSGPDVITTEPAAVPPDGDTTGDAADDGDQDE